MILLRGRKWVFVVFLVRTEGVLGAEFCAGGRQPVLTLTKLFDGVAQIMLCKVIYVSSNIARLETRSVHAAQSEPSAYLQQVVNAVPQELSCVYRTGGGPQEAQYAKESLPHTPASGKVGQASRVLIGTCMPLGGLLSRPMRWSGR